MHTSKGNCLMSQFEKVLGKYIHPTIISGELPLTEVVPFISNPQNRHGKTYQIPGGPDTVTILTDGDRVWFGVTASKKILRVELLGETGRAYTLFQAAHPDNLPQKDGDIRRWWRASRVRVLPRCKFRLVYDNK